MTEKMAAAVELAERGYRVLPCRKGAKEPATAHGLLDATDDVEIIARWWDERPDLNPAIRMDGMIAVDIDPGAKWPTDPQHELELSAAPTAVTPRDGRHHLFRAPHDRFSNTAGKIAEHVDTRACSKGYILVAPSEVGGRYYRWLSPLDCSPDALPLPPDWLLQALEPKVNGTALQVPHTLLTHPGEKPGKRNAVLIELVGRHLAEHGASADLPEQALAWAKRCEPEYPQAEVIKSVQALVTKHERNAAAGPAAKVPAATSIKLTSYAEHEPEQVAWLWKDRIPLGKLSELAGDPSMGKTTVLLDIAAHVSAGQDFPDGSPCPQGNVIIYTLEDGLRDTMIPRLMAAGGDRSRVFDLGPVERPGVGEDVFRLDRDLPVLRAALEQMPGVLLLVIDPISASYGDSVNENKNGDIRRVLGPLAKLAEEFGMAVLGNAHFGKAQDRKAIHRTLGSLALTAACRSAWAVVADEEDEDRRLLLPIKNNLANVDGLAFRLKGVEVQGCNVAMIEWEDGAVTTRLDEMGGGDRDAPAFDEAREWLQSRLTEPIPATAILKAAKADGISEKTLKRAKSSLGMKSERIGADGKRGGGEWHWMPLPSVIVEDKEIKGATSESIKGANRLDPVNEGQNVTIL